MTEGLTIPPAEFMRRYAPFWWHIAWVNFLIDREWSWEYRLLHYAPGMEE